MQVTKFHGMGTLLASGLGRTSCCSAYFCFCFSLAKTCFCLQALQLTASAENHELLHSGKPSHLAGCHVSNARQARLLFFYFLPFSEAVGHIVKEYTCKAIWL